MVRIAAYYPLISSFNDFPQKQNTPLHFGADLNVGLKFKILDLGYFRFSLGPALHLFFMTSDRWNYLNLGVAGIAGMELPLSQKFTFLVNCYCESKIGKWLLRDVLLPF